MTILSHFMKMLDDTPDIKNVKAPRRFKKRWILFVILLAIIILAFYAWSQRIDLAEKALRDQLEQYSTRVDYDIVEVGPRFQKLRNVVIGDPKNPDFSAKEIDIDVKISFFGAVLRTVWIRDAVLNSRYENDRLSFGALDEFLSKDSDEPLELPDLALDIAGSVMNVETPWGKIGVGLNGRGHLQSGFNGALALQSNAIEFDGCKAGITKFNGQIKISNKQPTINGALDNQYIRCAGLVSVEGSKINGEVSLSQAFDRWRGKANIMLKEAKNNDMRFTALDGNIDFNGDIDRTNIKYDLKNTALSINAAAARAGNMRAAGDARLTFKKSGYNMAVRGSASLFNASVNDEALKKLDSYALIADKSPIAPLLKIWAPALVRSASNFSANMKYDIAVGDTVNKLNNIALSNMKITSRAGGRLLATDKIILSKDIAKKASLWEIKSPISLAMNGDRLPRATATLKQGVGGDWTGRFDMPAYTAGDAMLALKGVRFKRTALGGWQFSGNALLSGTIPSGRVESLAIPIDGSWSPQIGMALYNGCRSLSFEMLQISDLRLNEQKIDICPNVNSSIVQTSKNGEVQISANSNNLVLNGLIGKSPINIRSKDIMFGSAEGVMASQLRVDLGQDSDKTSFEMDRFSADLSGSYVQGQIINGKGQIAAIPLEMDGGQLNWTFADNVLAMNGILMVRDAQQEDRFNPLEIPDLLLTMKNGEIAALAQLREPNSKRKVADVDIKHILSGATGRALLSVDNLLFDGALQPDTLTNIAVGVVANVQGSIDGDGQIVWSDNNVTSQGKFATKDMALAAAFGPISGLSGEIKFTDLLNFESEDRQILNLASVNTGVEVLDGRISYQLLPGQKVEVHGGSWPFSGGRLVLEPTIWDFAEDVERKLTFEVTGMEAATFLQQFDFPNLTASGKFNGRLPMVFNAEGGEIVGGSLYSVSGGNVAYVGELTYKDLSVFGNYAFNMLRSIDYKKLIIDMNGPIDGEIVTAVRLSGLQQGEGAAQNFITKKIAKIPLEFNVKIEAQFLELLNGAGIYDDPSVFIENYRTDNKDINATKNNDINKITDKASDENEQAVQPVASKDGL